MKLIQYIGRDFPVDYKQVYAKRKKKLDKILNLVNPCMKNSWIFWNKNFW